MAKLKYFKKKKKKSHVDKKKICHKECSSMLSVCSKFYAKNKLKFTHVQCDLQLDRVTYFSVGHPVHCVLTYSLAYIEKLVIRISVMAVLPRDSVVVVRRIQMDNSSKRFLVTIEIRPERQ